MSLPYLEGQYQDDIAFLRTVRDTNRTAFASLCDTQLRSGLWPYQIVQGTEPQGSRLSASTQAMILHALATTTGLISKSILVPSVIDAPLSSEQERVRPLVERGVRELLTSLGGVKPSQSRGANAWLNQSNTWGKDDPLTIAWLMELLQPESHLLAKGGSSGATAIRRHVRSLSERRLKRAAMPAPGPLLDKETDSRQQVPHPFILLRTTQLAQLAGLDPAAGAADQIQTHFENALNAELARNSVRDGGFDPASLVFSLEGLVLINADSISQSLVDRVIEVLGTGPELASHWRPVHPITATAQGLVLLPQSIEVANSLLRTSRAWQIRRADDVFARALPMVRQYAEWAISSLAQVRTPTRTVAGWQSEHTFEPGTIHLWATSQMLLFLAHFSSMLETHIATASREDARLNFRPTSGRPVDWRVAAWDVHRSHEPLIDLPEGHAYRVYDRAEDLFVRPRTTGQGRTYFSMLLYGPPGTGKTQFSRALANRLDYDFISISPSDFTRSGEAGVEARAQQVFDVLRRQTRCVVLFDEIDRLLLDRGSADYTSQGDMFQSMTPSMLTKFNDLREEERCIFVVATNYADHIDSAIKRPGRIDTQLLLLPPDLAQRTNIVSDTDLRFKLGYSQSQVTAIAKETSLFVFRELQELVLELHRRGLKGSRFRDQVRQLVRERPPTISIESYRTRLTTGAGEPRTDLDKGPWQEFALLVYLEQEVRPERLADWQQKVLSAVADKVEEPIRARLINSE